MQSNTETIISNTVFIRFSVKEMMEQLNKKSEMNTERINKLYDLVQNDKNKKERKGRDCDIGNADKVNFVMS